MKVIVTGAAGFIGGAFVSRLLREGHAVVGIDDLSRSGSHENLSWLRQCGGDWSFERADVRVFKDVQRILTVHKDAVALVHLAAQTAVTTSVQSPRNDFDVNAGGTLNLLEAVRLSAPTMGFVFASTNKVYGGIEHEAVRPGPDGYEYVSRPKGIAEDCPLDFHSPYGCSKGAADQYVRDYSRIYGLRTVVFRQSCIYGERQFGAEEQGWVAWFAIAAELDLPITICGDGHQVRDLLWVDDLCELYEMAITRIGDLAGRVFNVGGGSTNTFSVLRVLRELERVHQRPLALSHGPWRPGDQRIFIADITSVRQALGWEPKVKPDDGIQRLCRWVKTSRAVLERMQGATRS